MKCLVKMLLTGVLLSVAGMWAIGGKFAGAVVEEKQVSVKEQKIFGVITCNRQPDPWTQYRPVDQRHHWNNYCGCPKSCCGYRCCGDRGVVPPPPAE
jgi:hypothetical protein